MKTIVIIGSLLMASTSYGAEAINSSPLYPAPYCVPAPVVHHHHKHRALPQPSPHTVEVPAIQKNHLRLLAGVGPTGVGVSHGADSIMVTKNYNMVVGVAYGRSVSEHWSAEGAAMTNSTVLLGAGYNW